MKFKLAYTNNLNQKPKTNKTAVFIKTAVFKLITIINRTQNLFR
jgi:hypothetical protein